MGKGLKKTWLSAAECASRTGLTARALRVYERRRLISPQRNDKGWRRYSTEDLVRLNTITTLKSLGLSLARIGAILQGDVAWNEKALPQRAAMEFLVTARRIRMEKGGLENLHTEVQQLIAPA